MPEWPDDPVTVIEEDRRRAAHAASDDDSGGERDDDWTQQRHRADRRALHDDRKRRRRRFVAVLVVLGLLILPFVLAVGWFYFQVEPRGAEGQKVEVTIEDGWSTGEVGSALAQADVVGSAFAFRIWSTISGSGPYEPGTYTLRTNMGDRAAANVLKVGPPAEPETSATLLIPPGLTLNQVADRVGQLPGHNRDTFLQVANSGIVRSKYQPPGVNSLEGFLFPDFIGASEDDGDIVKRLVARFDEIADRAGLASSSATNGLTPYQTVVAASLIQTEAKLAEDAPLISAVIRNRLRDGMPLQIDSTLCYAKGGCPPVPTNADKAIDSPYNTYKNLGLPPTPISGVTEANLRAAINPAPVTYKYYVIADANGKHAFADTLAQHEQNVAAARRKGLL
jgi:peptidoglycan lytic transglycosylase G